MDQVRGVPDASHRAGTNGRGAEDRVEAWKAGVPTPAVDLRRGLGEWLRRGIAPRLLAAVLLFSSVVTLLLTSFQLYLDYRHDVNEIDARLGEIERSYLASLGQSLWHLDDRQLALQLEGILRLPDISAVEVREISASAKPLMLAAGQRRSGSVITREMPITHAFREADRPIGVLYVEATLAAVYQQLFNKALVILASQGAKTFLVSLFIIFIIHRLVTTHLGTIAKFLSRYDVRHPSSPLRLTRTPPKQPDELDQVVGAFNGMCDSLQGAYGDLRQLNAELKADVAARRRAEEALRESEQRFRDYAEIASDWFWETGPDHGFTYVSDRIGSFGLRPTRRIGKKRWEIALDVAEEPDKWRQHRAALEAHQPFRDFTYRSARADGAVAYVATSGKPLFDAAGRFLGYRGGSRDVTDAMQAGQALREAEQQREVHQAQRLQAEAEKLDLLQRLVDAQEQERLRIARELHDQLGQDLTGLSLGLKSLEASLRDSGGLGTLQWLQALTTQIGGNLHRTAWELRPTSLDDVGLLRALETYAADWSERFGIRVDFHAASATAGRFPPEVETAAYRVVQEALTNVAKHAAASTVSLVLERHEDSLQIIVEDDGRGFDPDDPAVKGRLGLAGMRERVALIGGTLTIDAAGGVGTTLYFRVPLAAAGQAARDVA